MVATLYDRNGTAIAYIDNDSIHIYTYRGKPAGYLSNEAVYSFRGTFLGRLENGWIRDRQGKCVFFTDNVSGGPPKPPRSPRPPKGPRSPKPPKGPKSPKPPKHPSSSTWSSLSGLLFFEQ